MITIYKILIIYQLLIFISLDSLSLLLLLLLCFFRHNNSWENPPGTSPHFKDGTQGKPDFVEARGFTTKAHLRAHRQLKKSIISLAVIEPGWEG